MIRAFNGLFNLHDYLMGKVLVFYEKLKLRGLNCHVEGYISSRGQNDDSNQVCLTLGAKLLTTIYTTSLLYKHLAAVGR